MTRNRYQHHFKGSVYIDILLPNLRALYSGCVPCIENNYLRQPSAVLKLSENRSKYFEGYVTFYCKHSNCCGCEVIGKAKFYTYHNKVEAVIYQVKEAILDRVPKPDQLKEKGERNWPKRWNTKNLIRYFENCSCR